MCYFFIQADLLCYFLLNEEARRGYRLSLVSFQTQSNFGKVLAKNPTCNLESSNIQNSNSPTQAMISNSSEDFNLISLDFKVKRFPQSKPRVPVRSKYKKSKRTHIVLLLIVRHFPFSDWSSLYSCNKQTHLERN